jgi:PAS domain S-box-containing protein
MLSSLKIPVSFLIIGIIWAALSNPVITFFARHIAISEQDSFRSLNELVFVVIISFVLYVEIKARERKLIKSEEEYRQLFEANPNPLWIYNNKSLRIVKVNNAAIEKYLYSKKKFLKMTVTDIRPAEDREKLAQAIIELKNAFRLSGNWRHVKANGEIIEVSIVSYPVIFNNEKCSLVIATDITELLEKERKLQNAYQKIKTFNETLWQVAWSNFHEMRKPVCSIISLISLLKHTNDNQERRQYLNLLETCSTELDEVLKQNERMTEMELEEV